LASKRRADCAPPLIADVRPRDMSAHTPSAWAQREVVRCAKAILSGELQLFAGCRVIAGLASDVVPSWFDDPDFVQFGAVASETDDLPLGEARTHWSKDYLAEADGKAAVYEVQVAPAILDACRNIVSRFGGDHELEQ
jgi:hypothetical protein